MLIVKTVLKASVRDGYFSASTYLALMLRK